MAQKNPSAKKAAPKKPAPKEAAPHKAAKASAPSRKAAPAKATAPKTPDPKLVGRVKKSAEPAVVAPKKPGDGKAAAAKKDASTKKAGATGKVVSDGAGSKAAAKKAAEKPQAPEKPQGPGKPQGIAKTPGAKGTVINETPPNGSGGRGGGRKADKGREEAPAPKPGKATSRYSVGDKVVHPQHGAATIAKRIKREFGGQVRDYYVLEISTESLTVMVPVEKVDSVVRSVISKTQSRNVLASLKEEPQEAGANWSRWYKVLTEKMYSGDIFQVAEVVRDLSFAQQTKGISPALKRMLSKARMTLISELSFSLEEDEDEATKRLDKALPKIETALAPIE